MTPRKPPLQFGMRTTMAFVALCAIGIWLLAPTFHAKEAPATVERISEREATQFVSQLLQSPEHAMPLTASAERYGWRVSSDDLYRGLFQVFGRDRQGQTAIIEHRGGLYRIVPSSYDVRVSLADKSGVILSTSEFSVGWRVSEADFRTARLHGRTFVIVEEISSRQYYAFLNHQLVLARLEDHQERIVRNQFGAPNLAIGPPVPQRTERQWESALESSDVAEVLQALLWLGGYHLNPHESLPDRYHEPLEAAQLVETTRNRPRVQQLLKKHVGSRDRWLHEAAELALTPEHYR